MKVIFLKRGNLESLLFFIFLFTIISCSQSIQMYSGPELQKSQHALVKVPNSLTVISINDMTFDDSHDFPFQFFNRNLYLLPGKYRFKVIVEQTSGKSVGSTHITTITKSLIPQSVWFYANAGSSYTLGFDSRNGKWELWIKNLQNH